MKKTTLFFSLVVGGISTTIVFLSFLCSIVVGETPLICVPPVVPALLFTMPVEHIRGILYNTDLVSDWPAILLGTFITWFVLGFIAKSIIDVIRDK